MTNHEIISNLNDLIESCKDGEEGFRTCSDHFADPYLKAEFATRSRSCEQAASELQELVRSLGGKPSTASGVAAALQRRWIDIKSVILGHDDEVILNQCERVDAHLMESYRQALGMDLPLEIRALVNRQYLGVLQNHDMVKGLRERLHAHS